MEIASDKARGGYYIKEQDSRLAERYEQLLLNFDLLNALAADSDLSSYVLAEHHRPLHSEWLAPLIGAIKGCHPVAFQYVLVRHGDEVAEKRVQPYYLKESNQRWYLLAYEGETLKTFGVDRIQQLQVLEGERFRRDREVDVDALCAFLEEAQLEAVLADFPGVTELALEQFDYYDDPENTSRRSGLELDEAQSREVLTLLQTDRWSVADMFTAQELSRGWADILSLRYNGELYGKVTSGEVAGEMRTVIFYYIGGDADQCANLLAPAEVFDGLYAYIGSG